ncbi:MAG: hypothetical protein JWO69_1497 [Thermoleophilia bacterium]|nr:hypothetical protein [Thermoleophilia bacterium]
MPTSDDDFHQHGGDFFPPPSSPRAVVGGLRAQSKGTRPGTTWWARRWLAALELLGVGERLERGRAYARDGQVISLEVAHGEIRAVVQGTRRTPYETRIAVAPLSQQQWLDVATQLATRAGSTAQLLAGDMPDDVEAVFARVGVALFPTLEDDLVLECTCTDWARPCKHVGAVCYLVGEAFDRDPFLMFRVRGIERLLLLALLDGGVVPAEAVDVPDVHQELDLDRFWRGEVVREPIAIDLQPPAMDAPLLHVLGPMPLWRGVDDLQQVARRVLGAAAVDSAVLDVALGSPAPPSIR